MLGGVNAVLYGVAQECLSDREWQLGKLLTNAREILRKSVPGRGDSRSQCPGAERCLGTSEEARVAGVP